MLPMQICVRAKHSFKSVYTFLSYDLSFLAPPSYEECIAEAKDPDEDGDVPFTPRYPVYRFNTLPHGSSEATTKN